MSDDQTIVEPCGVVAVFSAPDDGRVVAHAGDFEPAGYGGFTLKDAQEIRARQKLYHAVVRAMCSHALANCLDAYLCESICKAMVNKGYRVSYLTFGHDKNE